jgi:hypothetical protein
LRDRGEEDDGVANTEHWLPAPEAHDYAAATDYLSLLLPAATVKSIVRRLRKATDVTRKAKDLMRASGLPLLEPAHDAAVTRDLEKVKKGEKLSPILLVRGDARTGRPLLVADGYHRVCASYHLDEDAEIPCRLVDLPAEGR